jgi:hypothetical protein
MRWLPAVIVSTAFLSASCEHSNPIGPTPLTSTDALIAALRQYGAAVCLESVLPKSVPCFSVSGRVMFVNTGSANLFDYRTSAAAESDAVKVSSDGSSVVGGGCAAMISWVGSPHWYKSGQLLVVYAGAADDVLRPLEAVMGRPFASQ